MIYRIKLQKHTDTSYVQVSSIQKRKSEREKVEIDLYLITASKFFFLFISF